MRIKLIANGVLAHPSFPSAQYNSIHATVTKKYAEHQHYEHFSGALNAVAYRYHGTIKAGESLHTSLKSSLGTADLGEREKQEFDLFDFFSNGFSIFESCFYASYSVGAFLEPATFPLVTERDQQRVSPASTIAAFKKKFTASAMTKLMSEMAELPDFLKWREIRNVLTHRTAPGRKIYASIGSDVTLSAEWKISNIPLDDKMVPSFVTSMDAMLKQYLSRFDEFVTGELRK